MKSAIQNRLVSTALALGLASSVACSNAGKSDSQTGAVAADSGPTLGADVTKPSRIVISPKTQWSELKGYIVGRSDSTSLSAIADQPGKVGFPNLTSGRYDVILEGKEKDADGRMSAVALKISGINLVDNADVQIRDIELKPYVKLEGKALLSGGSNESHAGIIVSIPGTHYSTQTAADGSYVFNEIPEGNHDIQMSLSGYQGGFLSSKSYRASERLPTIALNSDSERVDNGVHYLGSPVQVGSAQKISLHLKAPASMNTFRFAVGDELMDDRPWLVLQSSLEIDLPAGDKPEVRVQYSLDERQLSPVFTAAIPTE